MNSVGNRATTSGPPLDYSFQDLHSIADLETHEATKGARHLLPAVSPSPDPAAARQTPIGSDAGVTVDGEAPAPVGGPVDTAGAPVADPGGSPRLTLHLRTTAIKLSYNQIGSLDGLPGQAVRLVDSVADISWLDLSHNAIEEIAPGQLAPFVNLRVVYLHANRIGRLGPVLDQLSRQAPCLQKLTLFGNPCESRKHYRLATIHAFPHLRSLDFIRVTPRDRDLADCWARDGGHVARVRSSNDHETDSPDAQQQ
ncbi:Leucine-rich repeat-containing protein [Plasmodiophora brassicae]